MSFIPWPTIHRILLAAGQIEEQVGLHERTRGLVEKRNVLVLESRKVTGFDIVPETKLRLLVTVAPEAVDSEPEFITLLSNFFHCVYFGVGVSLLVLCQEKEMGSVGANNVFDWPEAVDCLPSLVIKLR